MDNNDRLMQPALEGLSNLELLDELNTINLILEETDVAKVIAYMTKRKQIVIDQLNEKGFE